MAVSREKKKEILDDLTEKFKNAKSVVFSEYRGLTVNDISDLRGKLRESEVEYKVAKKTLIKLAAKEAGINEIPNEAMEGPVAAAFSFGDEVAGAREIYKMGKDHKGLKLKGFILDGEIFGQEKAEQLAQLPSKEELLAKLVGSLRAPISGFHGVLHGTLRGFVGTLQAIVDQGGTAEEEAPEEETPAEEAPAEEAPAEEAPAAEVKEEEKKEAKDEGDDGKTDAKDEGDDGKEEAKDEGDDGKEEAKDEGDDGKEDAKDEGDDGKEDDSK